MRMTTRRSEEGKGGVEEVGGRKEGGRECMT